MSLANLTDRRAVIKAIEEFDEIGRDSFLEKYSFGEAKTYYLFHKGKLYDSKAIVGAAHGYENPELGPLQAFVFSGGEATVEKKLNELGFVVYKLDKDVRERRYWALAVNPERYRIRQAIRSLDDDLWTIGESEVEFGDKVIIWQTLDNQGNRGILCLGEVRSNPENITDENNPFWVDKDDGRVRKPRVWVRYVTHNSFPIWLGEESSDHILQSLSIYRARGGTVFHVTEAQWLELMKFIGGWPGEPEDAIQVKELTKEVDSGRPGRSQGIRLPHSAKLAVEAYAMNLAKDYFKAQGMEVLDVSSRASFDLLCRDDDREFHVEVKGTTSGGDVILLTSNEVDQTREFDCALFVVSNIQLDDKYSQNPKANAGDIHLFKSWEAHRHLLKPLTFQCKLDYSHSIEIKT